MSEERVEQTKRALDAYNRRDVRRCPEDRKGLGFDPNHNLGESDV